jgi:hypothetical protein
MECHLVFVRTRTCGYLVMIYGCDLNLLILWLVLVLVVILRLTLDQFYWIYIYICGCCLDLYFVGEFPSKLLYQCICVKIKCKLYAHM